MRPRAAWRVAGCAAAVSAALVIAGLVLVYVDRRLVPTSLTGWTFSDVSGQPAHALVWRAGGRP